MNFTVWWTRCSRSMVFAVPDFLVESPFTPQGDQPTAINELANGVESGLRYQTLEGITGSGKTATIAWLIERIQRPTLILEPNKSLAAQLASELKEMMPSNREMCIRDSQYPPCARDRQRFWCALRLLTTANSQWVRPQCRGLVVED